MNTRSVAVSVNKYIGLCVSADTDTSAVVIMISSNRIWQASETHGCNDRNEAGISIHIPPYRLQV